MQCEIYYLKKKSIWLLRRGCVYIDFVVVCEGTSKYYAQDKKIQE